VATAAPAVKEAPAAPAANTYVFLSTRDPFKNDVEVLPEPAPDTCAEPLCRYALDEYKLTGIVTGMGKPVAVLESPKGKGYVVSQGMKVGTRGGVVKEILRDSVVVAERRPDGQGATREEEIVLRMRADAPVTLEDE
jgi:type IV pilus assembly protein PilP